MINAVLHLLIKCMQSMQILLPSKIPYRLKMMSVIVAMYLIEIWETDIIRV